MQGPAGSRWPWRSHDDYAACVKGKVKTFVDWGILDPKQGKHMITAATGSKCGGKRLKN